MNNKTTVIFGIRAVMEALEQGEDLEKVIIQNNCSGEMFKSLLQKLNEAQTPIKKMPLVALQKITSKNHQGVIAYISPIKYYGIEDLVLRVFESGDTPFFVVLDQITDVRNFGAIARSALALGVHGIIIPFDHSAQVNGDAIKTSSGALLKLPICRTKNLLQTMRYLKDSGIQIMACTEKVTKPIYEINFKEPLALVFGSEETGIDSKILQHADFQTTIPMTDKLGSLNVSVAASITCYEVWRQRNS